MMPRVTSFLIVASALAACSVRPPVNDWAVDAFDVGRSTDVANRWPAYCPTTPPDVDALCLTRLDPSITRQPPMCEYGYQVQRDCHQRVECRSDRWTPIAPTSDCVVDGGGCPELPPAMGTTIMNCPSSSVCAWVDGTVCVCEEAMYDPSSDASGGCVQMPHYFCAPPGGDPQCPRALPNDGTPCSSLGLACYWVLDCGYVATQCTGEGWQSAVIGCTCLAGTDAGD
jgi:hypothetical protein